MAQKNQITSQELADKLVGYLHIPQIIKMINESPIGNNAFLEKIGNKYLHEGYVKLSALFMYANHSRGLFLSGKEQKPITTQDFIDNHMETLRLILAMREDSIDKLSFETVIEEMICICTGGVNPGAAIGKALVENFLFEYLNTLEDSNNSIAKPVYWDNPAIPDYVYDIARVEIIGIESVSQYIDVLSMKTKSYAYDKEIFYRGQKSTAYSLLPSVFRSLQWRHWERAMFDELERLCPKSFEGMNTLLDCLVEMQHYELPTRLLDISSNALVALLFACDKEGAEKDDGEVLIFTCHNQQLCFGHSDKVTLLTAASQMKYEEQKLLYQVAMLFTYINGKTNRLAVEAFKEKLSGLLGIEPNEFDENAFMQSESNMPTDVLATPLLLRTIIELLRLWPLLVQNGEEQQPFEPEEKDKIFTNFNNLEIVKRLVRQAQREKPYFENRVVPSDLLGALFVKPAMLNQRIVKQSGAFMICGLMPEENGDITKILNTYRYSVKKIPVIIVPATKKNELLHQLSICDLHSASIYPEIDKVAGHIKEQFKKRIF